MHQENEGFQASVRVVESFQAVLKGSTLDQVAINLDQTDCATPSEM